MTIVREEGNGNNGHHAGDVWRGGRSRSSRDPRAGTLARFASRYLRVHSFFSLPGGRVRGRGLELVTRYLQPGFRRGYDRISQVPGEPQVSVRHVQSTPAELLAPDHHGAAARPLVSEQQRLPRKVFRRSIAWLSDSLSTLRSVGYPRPTQDSLLRLRRIGQTLLDGRVTRRVPMRGFRVLSTSHPPLPSLPGAIGSTDASASLPARVGVVGRATFVRSPDCGSERERTICWPDAKNVEALYWVHCRWH
jgi:hypothetical protein